MADLMLLPGLPTTPITTPVSFSYQPTTIIATTLSATPATHGIGNGFAIQSSNDSSTETTTPPVAWYNTQWREPITYMLLVCKYQRTAAKAEKPKFLTILQT
jgi:hypothetical protein